MEKIKQLVFATGFMYGVGLLFLVCLMYPWLFLFFAVILGVPAIALLANAELRSSFAGGFVKGKNEGRTPSTKEQLAYYQDQERHQWERHQWEQQQWEHQQYLAEQEKADEFDRLMNYNYGDR